MDLATWENVTALTATKAPTVPKASVRSCALLTVTMAAEFVIAKMDGKDLNATFPLLNAKCQPVRATVDASKASVIATADGRDRFVTKVS